MAFISFSALVLLYASLNILAFTAFTFDKLRAKMKGGRISEFTLLLLAALGPFGALAAMVGLRHKTRHVKFFLIPLFAIVHMVLILLLWPRVA